MSKTPKNTIISNGNSKIGRIPNVSMTPCASCNHNAPCRKAGQCYAIKALMYPGARNAWAHNHTMAQHERVQYMYDINAYIQKRKPRFFRWHVAGDILDAAYLDGMRWIAKQNPQTRFLAFTKMHGLNYRNLPENLSIVFSMWPRWGNTKKRMPRAWMQDGSENRIPADAVECTGQCDTCGMCWSLGKLGKDVWFAKH